MHHISNSVLSTNSEHPDNTIESSLIPPDPCSEQYDFTSDQCCFEVKPRSTLHYFGIQQQPIDKSNYRHHTSGEYGHSLYNLEGDQTSPQPSSTGLTHGTYPYNAESESIQCDTVVGSPVCFPKINQWEQAQQYSSSTDGQCIHEEYYGEGYGYGERQFFGKMAPSTSMTTVAQTFLPSSNDPVTYGSNTSSYENNYDNATPSSSSSVTIGKSAEQPNPNLTIGVENKSMISSVYRYKNPKIAISSISISYVTAIKDIGIDTSKLRIFVLDLIKSSTKTLSNKIKSNEFYYSCSMNLTPTLIKARQYIKKVISPHIIELHGDDTNFPIRIGMSIHDIKCLMVNNNEFFSKLSERCIQLGSSMMTESISDDISLVLQSSFNVGSKELSYRFNLPKIKRRSVNFKRKMSEIIAECIFCLPEEIRGVIINAQLGVIKGWLFSNCHGACFYSAYLKNICAICIETHNKILESRILADKVQDIAEDISVCGVSCFYALMDGSGLLDHIRNLAKTSTYELTAQLRRSPVFDGEVVVNLNETSVREIAGYLVRDIIRLSLESYKEICVGKVVGFNRMLLDLQGC